MATATDIANRALALIGEDRITSMDDSNERARACKNQYDIVRRGELRANSWRFALRRAQLAALADAPAFGFAREFPLPSDCVRPHRVGDYYVGASLTDYRTRDESAYSVEAGAILTDLASPLNLVYVRDETDASKFDALFVDALSQSLAIGICELLTGSGSKVTMLMASHERKISEAKRVNAIEVPPEPLADDSWVLARQ